MQAGRGWWDGRCCLKGCSGSSCCWIYPREMQQLLQNKHEERGWGRCGPQYCSFRLGFGARAPCAFVRVRVGVADNAAPSPPGPPPPPRFYYPKQKRLESRNSDSPEASGESQSVSAVVEATEDAAPCSANTYNNCLQQQENKRTKN